MLGRVPELWCSLGLDPPPPPRRTGGAEEEGNTKWKGKRRKEKAVLISILIVLPSLYVVHVIIIDYENDRN